MQRYCIICYLIISPYIFYLSKTKMLFNVISLNLQQQNKKRLFLKDSKCDNEISLVLLVGLNYFFNPRK